MCDGAERALEEGLELVFAQKLKKPLLGKEIFLGKEYPLSELPGTSYQSRGLLFL